MKFLNCMRCGEPFETLHGTKKYCSRTCMWNASHDRMWEKVKTDYSHRCKKLLDMAKNRTKSSDTPFDLDKAYLVNLWEKQGGRCAISGREFQLERPTQTTVIANAPSLDRITPSKGYTKGNVRLVCYQINTALNEYGLDALIDLCHDVINNQHKKAA